MKTFALITILLTVTWSCKHRNIVQGDPPFDESNYVTAPHIHPTFDEGPGFVDSFALPALDIRDSLFRKKMSKLLTFSNSLPFTGGVRFSIISFTVDENGIAHVERITGTDSFQPDVERFVPAFFDLVGTWKPAYRLEDPARKTVCELTMGIHIREKVVSVRIIGPERIVFLDCNIDRPL